MSINIIGDGNIVAGRDIISDSHVDKSVTQKIPEELQEEFRIVTEYICRINNPKEEKKSRINKFKDSLVAAGASSIVGEVVKYLFSLL